MGHRGVPADFGITCCVRIDLDRGQPADSPLFGLDRVSAPGLNLAPSVTALSYPQDCKISNSRGLIYHS